MLHSSAKGLPVSLAAIGVFPTARPRSFGPQGLRRFDAPPGVLSLLLYFLFLPLSLFDAPLEAHCPVFFTDGCIARAWRAVTNPFRFFFAVLFCVCLCVPASSQGMPAPLASLFLLLMIPSPCLSSYFIKKEHGGFKRGDTGCEEGGGGAGTRASAQIRAQMDFVSRYVVTVCRKWLTRAPFTRSQCVRAVLFCVCLCVPASSQEMPAPLASLFLLLMIPSPCLSSYFIKKEHGGFKRGDTGSEESEDGAGTCTTAWTRAQMDLVNRYVIVRAQDVSQRPSAHRGQRVRCPPAAGLHAGSSTVSGGDAGLQ